MIANSKVFSSTLWSFFSECMAKMIVPLSNMILARILTPDIFGIVVTINMVLSFSEIIMNSGFNKFIIQANFKTPEDLYETELVAFWTNMLISLVILIGIFFYKVQIVVLLGNKDKGKQLIVASFILPLNIFSSIHESLCKRELNFKVLFYIRGLLCIIPFFITIPLALLGLKEWSLIIGMLASSFFKSCIYFFKIKNFKIKFYYSFFKLKKIFNYGSWNLAESIVSWFITWLDIFFINKMFSNYYIGLYKNSQNTVTSILSIITAATQPVLFSVLAKKQNNKEDFCESFLNYTEIMSIFIIPMGIGIYSYSDFITRILLGEKWIEASKFIGLWGLFSAIVCLFGDLNREAYKAYGYPKISFFIQSLHLTFLVVMLNVLQNYSFDKFILIRPLLCLELSITHIIFTSIIFKISIAKYMFKCIWPIFISILMFLLIKLIKGEDNNIFENILQICMCIIFYFSLFFLIPKYRKNFKNLFYERKRKH